MISRRKVRKIIDYAEAAYCESWRFLTDWKDRKLALSSPSLLRYQPRLAEVIYDLGWMYQSIARERKSLIVRKNDLSPKWFNHRMRILTSYQTAILETVKIGRILGDYFVWIFYQDERQHLRKHFEHQPITQVPSGMGGKGELAFISKFGVLNGHLTLYHGITTFLRIGDVSFWNPKTNRISGIGEIKTVSDTGSKVGMTLYYLWPRNSSKVWPRPSKSTKTTKLPVKLERQLKRQLESMAASLKVRKTAGVKIYDRTHLAEFRQLIAAMNRKGVAAAKLGDGLLLVGVKTGKERSLFSRLLINKSFNKQRLLGIENYARDIFDPTQFKRADNANRLFMQSLDMTAFPGATPMFWWPIPTNFVRKLLFHEVTVIAVYNPAHLARKLRACGFDVRVERKQVMVKKDSPVRLEMQNMNHLLLYIQQHFLREEFVIQMFQNVLKRLGRGKLPRNTLISLHPELIY
ncbi:MAG: hypothetical protein ACXWID_09370 [Pyrinomonadaceae bacterium]